MGRFALVHYLSVLLAAASSSAFSMEATKLPAGRNLRLGKAIEHMPSKSMFLTKYGHMNGHSQGAGGSIWPVSVFWTYIEVGTPPQKYPVTIDSGSSDLYILGQNCTRSQGCVTGAPNHAYHPSESRTSRGPIGDGFNASYLTCNPVEPKQVCTIGGKTYFDEASFHSELDPVRVRLGAIENQTSNFYQFQTVEGVMGMVGNGNSTLFYQQCIGGGKCGAPVWAICMHEGSKSNGTLTIGGVDESLADGPIEYVPSTNRTFVHIINVHHMMVGGTKVPVHSQGVLDTGTNDVLLSAKVYAATKAAVCGNGNSSRAQLRHCDRFFNNASFCAAMSDAEVRAYPDISFQLDRNVTLTISARDYLLKNSPAATSPDQYCLGLSNGGTGYAEFIIGDTLMQNYYLVFKEQEVGWGKVNKQTCGSR